MSVPTTSSDLERRDARGQNFLADLRYYDLSVCPRMTEFAVIIQVDEKHISRGSATSPSQGGGTPAPPKFWDLLHARTQYEKQQPDFAW